MPTFTFNIYGKEKLTTSLGAMANSFPQRMLPEMKNQMVRLADYVRANKLSGQVLNRRSGALSRAVTGQAEVSGTTVVGTVGTSGIPYAGIHEFGADFSRAVTMAWGRPIIPVMAIFHYPERSFLRSSSKEQEDVIMNALRDTAIEVLRAT